MKYKVDMWSNFCRVFEMPEKFPGGFCFGGGLPVNFQMVDWFCPTDMGQPAVTKEVWKKNVGEIEVREIDGDKLIESLSSFLKQKTYVKPNRKYLVLCNFGLCFIVEK